MKAVRQSVGVMHLLRPAMLGAARGTRAAKGAQAVVAGAIVWLAIFWLGSRGLGAFAQYPEIADALRGRMLVTSIEAITMLTVMAATQSALDQCFLASEVPMLVRAPVDWLVRCIAQMIRVAAWTLAPVGLVLTPLLAAAAWTAPYSLLVGVVALLGLIPLLALAASLGVLLAIVLASVSGAERGKGALVVIGTLLVAAVLVIMRESSGAGMLAAMQGADPMAMADMLNATSSSSLPVAWWANALAKAGGGVFDWAAIAGFWGVAIGLVAITASFYGLLYDRVRSLGGRAQRASRSLTLEYLRQSLDRVLEPRESAIVVSDFLRIWRNRADWSHTLLLGFAGAIYLANIATLPLGGNEPLTRLFAQVLTLMNIGVSGLILSSLAAHYVLPSVAFEWPGKLLLAGAPVPANTIVKGKYAVAMLVCLPPGLALAWLTAHIVGVGGGIMWVTLLATASTGSGVIALALWLGCREPRLVPDGAAQTIASIETTLFVALSFVLALVVIAAIAPYTLESMGTISRMPPELKQVLSGIGRWRPCLFAFGLFMPVMVAKLALRQAEKALVDAGVGQPRTGL